MKKADFLLDGLEKTSDMKRALFLSLVAHLVLAVATSVPLFVDWCRWGLHTPSTINRLKIEDRNAREAAERKAALEAKVAEANGAGASRPAAGAQQPAAGKADAAGKTDAAPTAKEGQPQKTPPEVQPLPPKSEFELGDDLLLD